MADEEPTGECYANAGRHLMNSNHEGNLTHGIVKLPDGKSINHAWVDEGKTQGIFEPEHVTHMSHDDFSTAFNPVTHKVYDRKTMMLNMLKHKHWGPWED